MMALEEGFFDKVAVKKAILVSQELLRFAQHHHHQLLEEIDRDPKLTDSIHHQLKDLLNEAKVRGIAQ